MGIRKFVNKPRETTKLYSEVPTVYATLIDLGEDYIYEHITLINELSINISLRFGQEGHYYYLTFYTDYPAIVYDGLSYNGIVSWKGLSEASDGKLIVQCF